MRPLKADIFLATLALVALALGALLVHAAMGEARGPAMTEESARVAKALGLTDLCLFTEARYTRHPSVADFATAFQDHPMALEHFPSGSLIGPPPHLLTGTIGK